MTIDPKKLYASKHRVKNSGTNIKNLNIGADVPYLFLL